MYAVVDGAAPSPFVSHSPKGSKGLDWSATWGEVVQHMAQRLAWADERFNLQVCGCVGCIWLVGGGLCFCEEHCFRGGALGVLGHVSSEGTGCSMQLNAYAPLPLAHPPPSRLCLNPAIIAPLPPSANTTQVITQEELKTNAAAREALSAALSTPNPSPSTTTPMFVGIGISDPEVAAFLTQATAQLPTALFWNSDPALAASSRVDGYSPATAGPLAQLLAQHVGFSREAKAAEVMKTLGILWGRDTSGEC